MDNECFLKLPALWKCSFKDKSSSCPPPFYVPEYPHGAPFKSPLGRVLQIWRHRRKQPVQSCLSKESLMCPLSTSSLPDTPLPGKPFLAAFHRVRFSDLSKARDGTSGTRCRRTFLSRQVVSPQTWALQVEASNYNASQKGPHSKGCTKPLPSETGTLG